MNQQEYRVLGLMSGTSLDGLDIADIIYYWSDSGWKFSIENATTIAYKPKWKEALKNAHLQSPRELTQLSQLYGTWLGENTNEFIKAKELQHIDFIANHGHTVHHEPKQKKTVQIGNGPELAAITKTPVVCDFRLQDVLLGGQGAPLVPIGDEMLFGTYGACINLGGFANISFNQNDERLAFDICPVNIVCNSLSERLDFSFDKNGNLARSGNIIPSLLNQLNSLDYYALSPPKSLGREWTDAVVLPLLSSEVRTVDLLRTFIEHAAIQIASVSQLFARNKSILITGGGAFNTFLLERLNANTKEDFAFILPKNDLINYKEALIFGLLGLLRWKGEVNCLKSVTGAKINHSAGRIYR